MNVKHDIPLDQAVALVRACQKMNCDTADKLFAMVERPCGDAEIARKATPAMFEAAWAVLKENSKSGRRDPRSLGTREVQRAIEAALSCRK